ncbi:N-6 DNA methylase [Rhodobacteraceae bacterium CCMM004]|nr:N-6 DNA methylase [Rhodobacteraceae bacterium CCMM004]
MRPADWKELLALTDRKAPEVFDQDTKVAGTPYADEIRKAMRTLSISGVFCNQGVPQIMVLEQSDYDRGQVMRVHAALWNQGLASVLVAISADVIRVFSLARAPGALDHKQFEEQCLIEAIDAAADALSLKDYVYGAESGRLWLEKADFFDARDRIDAVLLNNLKVAHDLLSQEGLTSDEAQAILIQTMFVAYLEDRDIATRDYIAEITKGAHETYSSLLLAGDVSALEALFKTLQADFNGDLFVAPCSFDDSEHPQRLTENTLGILHRFREGREEMSEHSGQLRFWGYDFRYIPVELISAVYDRFLGHDPASRSDAGAYYTPMFLVDATVSQVWDTLQPDVKSKGVFLDPACGSGIFLVRSFQRLCEHWRSGAKTETIRWDSLLKMLERVRGFDINGSAVRVAVFSLYIALLEEVAPPDIRALAKKGRLLPPLWNRTLKCQDFFLAEPEASRADVVVGNPPWTSRRSVKGPGLSWSKTHAYPTPSGELAWAFVWKAREHLQKDGKVALLLPAMGFLHNHTSSSVNARLRLFSDVEVLSVINFSDLRRQLFDGAIHATALIIFQAPNTKKNYSFEYWSPKADLNLAIKRFITLSSIDKSILALSEVQRNPLVFKQKLWMRGPEEKLFGHLNRFSKLSDFVEQYGVIQKRKGDPTRGWVVGQGFKPYHPERTSASSEQSYESEVVHETPYLPVTSLTPVALTVSGLKEWTSSRVHRRGFERGFSGPRILFPRGVSSSGRLRATYTDAPLTFQHIIQAIAAPPSETDRAKFIAAILNSKLFVWFAFHGTSSFGSSRPEVQQAEMLRLPMPKPEELRNRERAHSIQQEVVQIVDSVQARAKEILLPPDYLESVLSEIDKLTFDYFDLAHEERILIEETVEFVIPALQPSAGSVPQLWKQTTQAERADYADQLLDSLSDWFPSPTKLNAELAGRNEDFAILKIGMLEASDFTGYSEERADTFASALKKLSKQIGKPLARNFQTIPDIRIFAGQNLYLIKPTQRRFWLRSAALSDADAIAGELQTLLQSSEQQSAHA